MATRFLLGLGEDISAYFDCSLMEWVMSLWCGWGVVDFGLVFIAWCAELSWEGIICWAGGLLTGLGM